MQTRLRPTGLDQDLVCYKTDSDSLGLEWSSRFFLTSFKVISMLLVSRPHFEEQGKSIGWMLATEYELEDREGHGQPCSFWN